MARFLSIIIFLLVFMSCDKDSPESSLAPSKQGTVKYEAFTIYDSAELTYRDQHGTEINKKLEANKEWTHKMNGDIGDTVFITLRVKRNVEDYIHSTYVNIYFKGALIDGWEIDSVWSMNAAAKTEAVLRDTVN